MKSILLSIRPEWVAKILNGEKTIEIRKKFPKDYVGWVYIYCTKEKNKNDYLWKTKDIFDKINHQVLGEDGYCGTLCFGREILNGKVVARFWCDKVWEIKPYGCIAHDLLKASCLKTTELDNYLKFKKGYAIPIKKLKIFNEPKELKTKAPQNYCYVERIRK